MMAGAAIGKLTRRPWLAFPAAFASHFLLDRVPHLDSHALFGVQHGGPTGLEAGTAIADIAVGVVLVVWAVGRQPGRRVMLGSAFFGVLIDLVDNVPPWGVWFTNWAGTAWLSTFHHAFQHNVTPAEWPLGVGTQLAVIAAALGVILRRRRTAGRSSSGENTASTTA